jgi:hypothetical protein
LSGSVLIVGYIDGEAVIRTSSTTSTTMGPYLNNIDFEVDAVGGNSDVFETKTANISAEIQVNPVTNEITGIINPKTGVLVSLGGVGGGIVQNRTRAEIIASVDLALGNVVNVTDNLPSGNTTLAVPTLPSGVQIGDRFYFYFKKLLATQCTILMPIDSGTISYQFNRGTEAVLRYEWSGTRLLEV